MIITPPRDITVFLNQGPAIFSCEINGGAPGWRVNGTIYETLSPEIRTDLMINNVVSENGYSLLTLTIPARAKYNETTVQCVTFNIELEPTESGTVTIKIQGNHKRTSRSICTQVFFF